MTKPTVSKKPSTKPTAMKGLRGFVEVFKAGTHKDSKGREITFSRADLDQMIENHKLGAAPAVIGHPTHTSPAYAQVEEYRRDDNDILFAKFTKINPAFEAGVESGAYYNRSVSVIKDENHGWRVRHVGWLGGMPPAIDGLKPVEFSADDDIFEFSAPGRSLVWGLESAARLLRKLRDRMIEKDGLEAADQTLPQWDIDSMTEAASAARLQFDENPALFNQQPGDPDMTFTQAQVDAAAAAARSEGEAAGRAAASTDMVPQADFAAAQGELAQLRKANQKTRIEAQIGEWKKKGLIVPADEAGLLEYMVSLEDAGQEFSFSAAGVEGKKTPVQFFADFMANRKPVIKLGGGAHNDDATTLDVTDSAAINAAASNFMEAETKAGRHITVAAAVQHVVNTANGAK